MTLIDIVFLLAMVIVQPWYSWLSWQKIQRAVAAGMSPDRVVLYRTTMAVQVGAALVLLISWGFLDRPLAALGLHGHLGIGFLFAGLLSLVALGALALMAYRVRSASPADRLALRDQLGELEPFLPHSDRELRNFFGLSVTAGVVEELLYRGFLLWLLVQWMPLWAAVLLSSIIFGLAHSYQGVTGMVRTGGIGLLLAALFVGSGSLWLPMLVHALFDMIQGVQIREIYRDRDAARAATADDGNEASAVAERQ